MHTRAWSSLRVEGLRFNWDEPRDPAASLADPTLWQAPLSSGAPSWRLNRGRHDLRNDDWRRQILRQVRRLGRVGRSRESRTSLRVETGASYLALEHGRDIAAPIFILTDSANHLAELEDWVGPGKYPTLHSSKDGDIVRGVLELLHHRVTLGFPTFFVKVRAHRGEP
jgi:hypothetical protein